MKKKLLATALALMMLLSLLPSAALAAEPTDTWADAVADQPTGYTENSTN